MAESLIQSVIKCPICLEAYVDPRMLPCLHSFCQKCLNGYIEKCRMAPTQSYFTCPVCREEIYPPHPYRPLCQWSTQFRSNFIMTDLASCLTEVAAKEKEESDVTGEVCFPCSKQMPFPKEAQHFCLDCCHPYCEACMQVHMSIPSCQKHSIVAIDDYCSREQHQTQHQHCAEHPEEALKMYCEDCTELLCAMCALMKHRQCSKLNSVTPLAAARRLQLETSQRSLICTLSRAKEKLVKLKEEKERLTENNAMCVREMDEAYSSLISELTQHRDNDLKKIREAVLQVEDHISSCEEQIGVFVAVLEENVTKTQSRQLISSDILLLQEVSLKELKEAENDVEATTSFLLNVDSEKFEVPRVAKKTLVEYQQLIGNLCLREQPVDPVKEIQLDGSGSSQAVADVEHTPAKMSAVRNRANDGHPSFALQLQQDRLACRSVLSTSSDISAASTSSSEGSLAYANQNPFSFVAGGKKSVRKPPARPRNTLARKVFSGPSVFSVKHPVVTAANSTVNQASPKWGSDNPGFVFVPSKNVTALMSQFKPIPKLAGLDPASEDTLLNNIPATSPISGAHTLPKPALPKPAGANADFMVPSSRGTNTQNSNCQTISSMKAQVKNGKAAEQIRKAPSNSLSVTSSSTMTSPKTTNNTVTARNSKSAEASQNEDQSAALEGAVGGVDLAAAVPNHKSYSSARSLGMAVQKREAGKLGSVFKICPSSAGDLRRPIISDFAVLPLGRLAVVDRANNRVKVVDLKNEGQDGLCPSLDLSKPHGVCHLDEDVIAVVSHVTKTLQLITVNNAQLTLQHLYNTCRGYLNISKLSPNVLAALFSSGVHVLEVAGAALHLKVSIVNDSEGNPLFQSPSSMCTTQDGKIVILDSMTGKSSCWDQNGAALWIVTCGGQPYPRSVCSVGLRRLYILTALTKLECIDAASGKLLHSVKLYDPGSSLKEVSTMAQDANERILLNNLEDIVCFDWI